MSKPRRDAQVLHVVGEWPEFDTWTAAFLTAYAISGNITEASEAAGVNPRTVRRWRLEHAEFAEAFVEAYAQSIERLEAELVRRIYAGSDVLLMFRLKKLDPSYRESYNPAAVGRPTSYVIDLSDDDPAPDQNRAAEAVLDK